MSNLLNQPNYVNGLWKFVKYLPSPLRARFLRSKFEITYNLPSAFSLKKAESADEIRQALRLIREAPLSAFSRHDSFSNTTILVAKWHDEVVASLSVIVDDAASKLPSENIEAFSEFRKNNLKIAEISTLRIKKDFRLRREKVILPLCKMMYQYCTEILKIDMLVTSAKPETLSFYTDVLLFKRMKTHGFVCYILFNSQCLNHYRSVYGSKERSRNLYHFLIEHESQFIHLPQAESKRQNENRIDIQTTGLVFINDEKKPEKCVIVNFSEDGIQVRVKSLIARSGIDLKVLVVFEKEQEFVTCHADVRWIGADGTLGCQVNQKSYSWLKFTGAVAVDLPLKKVG